MKKAVAHLRACSSMQGRAAEVRPLCRILTQCREAIQRIEGISAIKAIFDQRSKGSDEALKCQLFARIKAVPTCYYGFTDHSAQGTMTSVLFTSPDSCSDVLVTSFIYIHPQANFLSPAAIFIEQDYSDDYPDCADYKSISAFAHSFNPLNSNGMSRRSEYKHVTPLLWKLSQTTHLSGQRPYLEWIQAFLGFEDINLDQFIQVFLCCFLFKEGLSFYPYHVYFSPLSVKY